MIVADRAPIEEAGVDETRWRVVAAIFMAGVLAAFELGKASIALAPIRADLDMSLPAASWMLSMFGIVGAVLGLALGAVARAHGARRVTSAGLLVAAVGSLAGAWALGPASLLGTRFVEATGFICIQVAAPSLMALYTAVRHRWIAFAVWGAYMPLGQALVILLSPSVLSTWGWRALWIVTSALLCLGTVVLVRALADRPDARGAPEAAATTDAASTWTSLRRLGRTAGVVPLAAVFLTYTFQWIAVVGFLPTLYLDKGIPLGRAGVLTAAAVAANVVGNLSGGLLARLRVPRWPVLVAACLTMGLCGIGIFSDRLPFGETYALAVTFSAVGGLLPSTVFMTVPTLVGSARDLPAANGLVVQGSQIGSAAGPVVVANLVAATGGWTACGWTLAIVGLTGAGLGLVFRRTERAPGRLLSNPGQPLHLDERRK